jgi:tRNA pseudouridine13 synthase
MTGGDSLPFANPDLPGFGGRIKVRPEDFRVEEIPLYLPSGEGEHLYLKVEKRSATTLQLLSALTRAFGLPSRAAGHAGLKDAQAVTVQWISLHTPQGYDAARWPEGPWGVLEWSRHPNKLRPGHLRGNRFEIVVRGVRDTSALPVLVSRIASAGYPNYFGPQRFGRDGSNAARGKLILTSDHSSRPQSQHARLLVNAYQAELFNRVLALRLAHVTGLAEMLEGDQAVLHRNGASFLVDALSLAETQTRSDAGELSASAPLLGYRVPLAGGLPGQWEAALLRQEDLQLTDFRRFSKRDSPKGERRPVRVLPEDLRAELDTDGGEPILRLSVILPAGAYATSLLREMMKAPQVPDPD